MMSRDAGRGVVDRFRSMPITQVAIPFGQAAAQTLYGAACLLLIAPCGLAVGWRIRNGLATAIKSVRPARGLPVRCHLARHVPHPDHRQLADSSPTVRPRLAFAMISNIFPSAGLWYLIALRRGERRRDRE